MLDLATPRATLTPLSTLAPPAAQQAARVDIQLSIESICLIEPVLRVAVRPTGQTTQLYGIDSHQCGLFYPWLPRGTYQFRLTGFVDLDPGEYELAIAWGTSSLIRQPDIVLPFTIARRNDSEPPVSLQLGLLSETERAIAGLSWQQGMENWFHRHFCHAAQVVGHKFLKDSPNLRGRVLDVGAGEGITDLGLLLRYSPQEIVAVDIVDYLLQLPRVAQENDLPLEAIPENLRFVHRSANQLHFPDHYFDLAISWGSVEHIKGGYRQALDEVWRVLKPGGEFFVNPGLYYSPFGSHLGEFSDEPHLHLKVSEAELRELVMTTEPRIMDRSGFDVSREDYWRFYKELNAIKVADFERELKDYGFIIERAALRSCDMVEYTDALQDYSIVDLATEDAFFTLRKPR